MSDDKELDAIHAKILQAWGSRRFNRCIDAVSPTKQLGRLRFWQETAIQELRAVLSPDELAFLDAFSELEIFLYLFEQAEPREYSIEKTEFLTKPIDFYFDEMCIPDPEWYSEALDEPGFREYIFGNVVAAFSVDDDFAADERSADVLRNHLAVRHWPSFVEFVAQDLRIPPGEWRGPLLAAFPQARAAVEQSGYFEKSS